MSYSLQRIRLAEVSRRMIDRTPLVMMQSGGPGHDVVMDFDTELQLLLNDIPPFFSMSREEISATYGLEASKASNIVHQGYMHYSIVHSHRCRLHFPYFSLGFVDPRYASSRDICLQTAHEIIQTELRLGESGLLRATQYTFIRLLASVFMASIVILMDLCYNKSTSQQEKRRAEIADAIQILDLRHGAGEQIANTSKYTHKSFGRNVRTVQPIKTLEAMPTSLGSPYGSNSSLIPDITNDGFLTDENMSSYFTEIAQSFEQNIDLNDFDWNSLLTGLDTSLV
jgi:hypothetical protein